MQRKRFLEDLGARAVLAGGFATEALRLDTRHAHAAEVPRALPRSAINVRSVGAVGDGATDDTTAIRAALEAATASGSALVHFPAGVYLCGSLALPSDTTLVGDSWRTTALRALPETTGVHLTDGGNATGIQIQNLQFHGNGLSDLAGLRLGLENAANHEFNLGAWLKDVRVVNYGGIGIELGVNVAELVDVWSQWNATNLSIVSGCVVRAARVACEGARECELKIAAMDCTFRDLHIETDVPTPIDIVGSYGAVIDGVTISVAGAARVEQVVRIGIGVGGVEIRNVRVNLSAGGSSYRAMILDQESGVVILKDHLPNPSYLGSYTSPDVLHVDRAASRDVNQRTMPPLSSGENNDLDPGEAATLRLSGAESRSVITGISGGRAGRRIRLINVASSDGARILITHEDRRSRPENRLIHPSRETCMLGPDALMDAEYDGVTRRWRITNTIG